MPTSGIILRQNTDDESRVAVTIASGAAVSNAIRVSKVGPRGIAAILAAAWTAADIGLEVTFDADSETAAWIPVEKPDGTRVRLTSVPTAPSVNPYRPFPAEAWAVGAATFIRLVSLNTATGAAANQSAARSLTVVFLS